MTSIVLEPGIKEMILNDCKDFLQSEDWYAERGAVKSLIPLYCTQLLIIYQGFRSVVAISCMVFREGILNICERDLLLNAWPTHSGKTSLIHSLAGELGLDIYVVSLSSKGMSDNMLSSLMGDVPSRCIVLLEVGIPLLFDIFFFKIH